MRHSPLQPTPHLRRIARCAIFGIAFACACTANDGATAPNGLDMLRVVAGDGQSDTVLATLAQPLIVEVRDSTG